MKKARKIAGTVVNKSVGIAESETLKAVANKSIGIAEKSAVRGCARMSEPALSVISRLSLSTTIRTSHVPTARMPESAR